MLSSRTIRLALFPAALGLWLAACNSTNVDKDSDGPGGGDSGGTVGRAPAFNFADTSVTAVATEMSGEYEVAIYAAPDSLVSKIGKAKFKVEFAADSIRLILRDGAGAPLFSRSSLALDRSCGEGICVSLWGSTVPDALLETPGTGRRVVIYNYYQSGNSAAASGYFDASFYVNGVVSGTVGDLKFRNAVLAYGPAVPAQLKSLAGAFAGPAQQHACDPNPVNVEVAAVTGLVRVQGKVPGVSGISFTCPAKDLSVTWNGNDDLVVPTDTGSGAKLILNAGNLGGSLPGGGIFITLPAASGAVAFTHLYVNFAGADGNITLSAPVRQ